MKDTVSMPAASTAASPYLNCSSLNTMSKGRVSVFMGWLAATGDLSEENMRKAVVYGSAMGSFAVEKFSNERTIELTRPEIEARVREFHRLVAFEAPLPA